MTDNITLRRAVEQVREALTCGDGERRHWCMHCDDHVPNSLGSLDILAALDAALAEPPAKPKPVVVEQLFALAKLTVRRAADPDPWVWDRLADDGTWTPFNPLIHGPDMWRLEQAIRAALAEPDATREPATDVQAAAAYDGKRGTRQWVDFRDGWLAAERFHGIRKEDGK
jgi:hypothetical protein